MGQSAKSPHKNKTAPQMRGRFVVRGVRKYYMVVNVPSFVTVAFPKLSIETTR